MSDDAPPTILLAEDEAPIRKLIAKILAGLKYKVLEASHGEEALAVSERFPGTIHLLVTDIMMPVMNGRELAARLSHLRPEMRILFISGYPGGPHIEAASSSSEVEFLAKPFKPETLLERVAALLRKQGIPPPPGDAKGSGKQ